MVRFALLLALGLQPVIGQFCALQSSCSSCVSLVGCVWNLNSCWSIGSISPCSSALGCYSAIGECPLISAPLVYPSASFSVGAGAVLPPLLPPIYSSSFVSAPFPIVSDVSYTAPLDTAPVLSAPPITTVGTPIATPIYNPPIATPIYNPPIVSASVAPAASFAAPVYASDYVAPVGGQVYGGFYGNAGFNSGPPPLFDTNGRPVYNTVRNNLVAGALEPMIPGIGATVSAANDFNLLANSPQFINSDLNGVGYRRHPVDTFVRNGFYANALGKFMPGLTGSLNTFNELNLLANL